ncbi:hypothetical protein [Actinomadura sp. HBU206391]|uniref:hypothetical protein n=1 Tax=Actinomadura sp. HBU206391 TaxID=2731692 RepID=UPI001650003A|nr:hypothetical protein [Actinomadura sp. HBU206391]MBC6461515.1 hypothetical protein [Actinomadura sp. HBU206391]
MSARWDTTDAWVFASIEGTGLDDGYTLAQIISKSEGIRHASLEEDELVRAVPRLIAAGLIGADAQADRYWHTEAGQELYRKRMKGHGLFGWSEALLPGFRKLGDPQDGHWSLPAGAYDRAYQEYRKKTKELLKRHDVTPAEPEDGP